MWDECQTLYRSAEQVFMTQTLLMLLKHQVSDVMHSALVVFVLRSDVSEPVLYG